MKKDKHIFQRNGLASVSDINTNEWRIIFEYLKEFQDRMSSNFMFPTNYRWPKTPLYNFIRVWEYPYVYYQIREYLKKAKDKVVVDLGSGVTFFPFAVSEMGCKLIAVDNDPVGKESYPKLSRVYDDDKVMFLSSNAKKMKLENSSVDVVYCISVLEHIDEREKVVRELGRILKKGGLCVLTFDLNMNNNDVGIGVEEYYKLRNLLDKYFIEIYHDKTVHPLDVLNCYNSKYPLYNKDQDIVAKLFKKKERYNITSVGLTLVRR